MICALLTVVIFVAVAVVALVMAILQVAILLAVGRRYQGFPRSLLGTVFSSPAAIVIGLLPALLVQRLDCGRWGTSGLGVALIGAYASAVIAYFFAIKARLPELQRNGFFK